MITINKYSPDQTCETFMMPMQFDRFPNESMVTEQLDILNQGKGLHELIGGNLIAIVPITEQDVIDFLT